MSRPESGEAPGEGGGAQEGVFGVRVPGPGALKKNTDLQWEFAVGLRKLKQGLWINLEGWGWEGDGREVQKGEGLYVYLWLIHVEV